MADLNVLGMLLLHDVVALVALSAELRDRSISAMSGMHDSGSKTKAGPCPHKRK